MTVEMITTVDKAQARSMDDSTTQLLAEIAGGRLLIREPEVRRALGMSKPLLDREVEAGRLRYVLIGKRRRFKPGDLADYIKQQERRGCAGDQSSSNDQTQRFGGIGSPSPVVLSFEEALAQTPRRKPSISPPRSTPRLLQAALPSRNPRKRRLKRRDP